MIVIKETEYTKGDDWWKKEERGGYYVTTEYYLLKGNWKCFTDCKQSKTQIIEYLQRSTHNKNNITGMGLYRPCYAKD